MREAAALGRFAIVTGGAAWGPMLRRLALALGLAETLDGIHTVAPSGAELAADPERARALLRDACVQAMLPGVRSVILGGAGLAGMAARLQGGLPLPLIDSVVAGTQELLKMPRAAPPAAAGGAGWIGIAPELADFVLFHGGSPGNYKMFIPARCYRLHATRPSGSARTTTVPQPYARAVPRLGFSRKAVC